MATDTTELTFVRCPECRSLVPAMSTRCRMCGAGLGTDLKSETPAPAAPSSRVRQKTTTTSSGQDFNDQISKVREDHQDLIEAVTTKPVEPAAPVASPLDDFLSDEEEAHQATHASAETAAPVAEQDEFAHADADDDSDEDLDDFDDLDDLDDFDDFDDFDDELDEVTPAEASEPIVEAAAVVEVPKAPVAAPTAVATEVIQAAAEKVATATAATPTITPKPTVRADTKPRVVIEQGRGKFSKGLSFGGSPAPTETPAPRRFDAKAPPVSAPIVAESEPVAEVNQISEVPTQVAAVTSVQPPVIEEKIEMKPQTREVEDTVTTRPQPRLAPKEGTKDAVKKGEQLGRIYGWLVSFADANGSSIELREGRFFVSSSQLRSTDLVLEDDTISTPHAMFSIGTDTGLSIQDLKSDRGVFIRTADSTTYHREYDTVVLEHGDWVRFGDLEFLVSVIAHVGAK